MNRPNQGTGRAPESLQEELRRQMEEDPAPESSEPVLSVLERDWWIPGDTDGGEPVQAKGAQVQELLSQGTDIQVCAVGSQEWVLASSVEGFTLAPSSGEGPTTEGTPDSLTNPAEQAFEPFPDPDVQALSEQHNLTVRTADGEFDRVATIKALAAAGVQPG